MEMFLTKASDRDLIKKIKDDKNWLTNERLEYIAKNREEILDDLDPKDINEELIKELLKKEKILLSIAFMVDGNKKWKPIITEAIPRPITKAVFKEDGILLNYLKEEDYSHLVNGWIKSLKNDSDIPDVLQKYLNEEQVIKFIRKVEFKNLSEQAKTPEVCFAFINGTYKHFVEDLYSQFPQEAKDNHQIAFAACYNHKQFYKKLSPKAQCNERVISHVINASIPPAGDYDTYHTDTTAINPNELSIEAVRCIKESYNIKKILKAAPKFLTDPIIQENWINNKKYQADLYEFYDYFNEESKNSFHKYVMKQGKLEKASILKKLPQLKPLIINKNNVQDSLEILYNSFLCTYDLEKTLKLTGLQDVMDKNLSEFTSLVINKNGKSSDYNDEKYTLSLADALLKKDANSYKQAAIEMLAPLVRKNSDLLGNLSYDYSIEGYDLHRIESELYEYIDANPVTPKPKKKKI